MYSHNESTMNGSSGHVRRTQSMPHQSTASPPPQSVRRVASAVLERPTYPTSNQTIQAQAAVAYPYPIHNPSREVYYNPPPVPGLPGHRSPIDQQREQLEQYNRNRVHTRSYVSVSNFLVLLLLVSALHLSDRNFKSDWDFQSRRRGKTARRSNHIESHRINASRQPLPSCFGEQQ